jgi:hypothetical protein
VIEMLHQTASWKIRVPSYTIIPISSPQQSQYREMADKVKGKGCDARYRWNLRLH